MSRKQVGAWTAVGIGVGVAIGVAVDSLAMWICIGTIVGALVGMALDRRRMPLASEALSVGFSGSTVEVDRQVWHVEYPVLAACRMGEVVCLILDYMAFPKSSQAHNLRGYTPDGRLLWVAQHPTDDIVDCYTVFIPGAGTGQLHVNNLASFNCVLDPLTGRLLRAVFTK